MKIQVERAAGTSNLTECTSAEGKAAACFSEKHTALTEETCTQRHTDLKSLEAPANYFFKKKKNHTADLLINHLLVNMNQQITKVAPSVS